MPSDNIDRAVKKGTGELASEAIEELIYEGYGPEGVAIVIEAATDNKNRTAADLRSIFGKNGGNLAASGSVMFQFHRKGKILVSLSAASEEQLLEVLLESNANAEEITIEDEMHLILTPPDQLYAVSAVLRDAGIPMEEQKLTFLPESSSVLRDSATARQVLRLCQALDDCDDVLEVHANFEIPDEILEESEA